MPTERRRMSLPPADNGITLLADVGGDDGAEATFRRVVERFREASRSIAIHMFVWRSDEIGNAIGREVLAAAERGVRVHIKKDAGASLFERVEMNRKPFFDRRLPLRTRLLHAAIAPTFPDTYIEDGFDCDLGRKVLEHRNVTVEWVNHTHTKYYIIDDRILITGSINIEDRHRRYRDYMIEIAGEEPVRRLRERERNEIPCDADRPLEFVLNDPAARRFEVKPRILDLLSRAERSAYIEMAYIGDPDVSRKIAETANRGIRVALLFSREANIGNDINYKSLRDICRRADLEVYLTPRMVHSKMMLIDDETVILGSANISVFSMQRAAELDVVIRKHPVFLEAIRREADRRVNASQRVRSIAELARYNRLLAALQQIHQKLG